MKKITLWLLLSLIIGLLIVIVPFLMIFPLQLSQNVDHWSAFGSYIGGLMSPYIAALALVGLLFTIHQQNKQISRLDKTNQCNQLEIVITELENDFKADLSNTPLKKLYEEIDIGYTCLDPLCNPAFTNWRDVIPDRRDFNDDKSLELDLRKIKLYGLYGLAAGNLNQLFLYVDKHEELSGSNLLSKYFKRKYRTAHTRLSDKGFINKGL